MPLLAVLPWVTVLRPACCAVSTAFELDACYSWQLACAERAPQSPVREAAQVGKELGMHARGSRVSPASPAKQCYLGLGLAWKARVTCKRIT